MKKRLLRKRNLKTYKVYTKVDKKTNEGSTYIDYEELGSISAMVWPATGKQEIAIYGTRVIYVLNMLSTFKLAEGTGISVYDEDGAIDYYIETRECYDQVYKYTLMKKEMAKTV